MAYGKPCPQVVEFKTKFHFQIWSFVLNIVKLKTFGGLETFFQNQSLHTEVHQTSVGLCSSKGCTQKLFIYLFYHYLHGPPFKLTGFLKQLSLVYSKATDSCNTVMEWKFCQLSELVQVKKLRLLIKSTYWFK